MKKKAIALLLCLLLIGKNNFVGNSIIAESLNDYQFYKRAIGLYNNKMYNQALEVFEALGSYENSQGYTYKCVIENKNINYKEAQALFIAGEFNKALLMFEEIPEFKNSKNYYQQCLNQINNINQREIDTSNYNRAMEERKQGNLEAARDLFIEAGNYGDATEQIYSINRDVLLKSAYKKAELLANNGDYTKARAMYSVLGDYADSPSKLIKLENEWKESLYTRALAADISPTLAWIILYHIGDYKNSIALAEQLSTKTNKENIYTAAKEFEKNAERGLAKTAYEYLENYKDSKNRLKDVEVDISKYNQRLNAIYLCEIGEYEQAALIFRKLGTYMFSSSWIVKNNMPFSAEQLRDYKKSAKSGSYIAEDNSKHIYQIFKGPRTWAQAKIFCEIIGGHLATLTTEKENSFVHDFMVNSGYTEAYFGLSDESRTGNWEWITGEKFEFCNWYKGEPSKSPKERFAMFFTTMHIPRTWNDSHFYEYSESDPGCSFICEWDY